LGLLGCFLRFTNFSDTTNDFLFVAFFLFIFGWACYCF
jgi:hypothetical protein